MDYLEEALKRLKEGAKTASGRMEQAVARPIADTLSEFCRQDGEFAQAVAQGGTFGDCLKAVLSGVSGSISDIEAYRRAAQFYFPGCVVEMQMVIRVNPHEAEPVQEPETRKGIVLSFEDFF